MASPSNNKKLSKGPQDPSKLPWGPSIHSRTSLIPPRTSVTPWTAKGPTTW